MPLTPVKSSTITKLGYDKDTRTMNVEFHNGKEYEYADVPLESFEGLNNAESIGKYFHEEIRPKFKGVFIDPNKI